MGSRLIRCGETQSVVEKRNVAWIHVCQMDAVAPQFAEDRLYVRPIRSKLFFFVSHPFIEDLRRIVGRSIQICAAEIKDVRPGHHCHFKDQKFVVVLNQSRDVMTA